MTSEYFNKPKIFAYLNYYMVLNFDFCTVSAFVINTCLHLLFYDMFTRFVCIVLTFNGFIFLFCPKVCVHHVSESSVAFVFIR